MLTAFGGYVYIMTTVNNTTLYVGVAASISTRVEEHRSKMYRKSFTARYNICKLVYYEFFDTIEEGIDREKEIKKYSRLRKLRLIIGMNPKWDDLYDDVSCL